MWTGSALIGIIGAIVCHSQLIPSRESDTGLRQPAKVSSGMIIPQCRRVPCSLNMLFGNTAQVLSLIGGVVFSVWLLAEVRHSRLHAVDVSKNRDKSSFAIIVVATAVTVPFGILLGCGGIGHVERQNTVIVVTGILLLLVGVAIRWTAIRSLKTYFTSRVTILHHHELVKSGLYRTIRHPGYLGYLFVYLGLGLALANWLSILVIFLPQLTAILYRIQVEEQALTERFGVAYSKYVSTTKRLIPKVY
jgi:protein-S-isoprenylcysteine O-methyltransferase Ste14